MLADPVPPRVPRDLSTVLWRRGRLSLICEPRDLWVGAYVAHGAVYVILVPCFPLRWERGRISPLQRYPRPFPDDSSSPAEWMPGGWA